MQVYLLQHQFNLQVTDIKDALGSIMIKNAKLLVEECAWHKFDNPSGNGVSGHNSNFEIFLVVCWTGIQHRAPSQTNYVGLHALYPLCRSSDYVAFTMQHLMPRNIRETLLDRDSEHVSSITTRRQAHLGADCPLDLQSLMERVNSEELNMDEDTEDDAEGAAAEAQAVKVLSNKLLKLKHSKSRSNTFISEISKAKLTIENSPVGIGEEAAIVRPAPD